MKTAITSIVITGSSVLSAAGTGVAAIRELISTGNTAFTTVPHDVLDSDDYLWGKHTTFKASDFLSPMKARKMDRSSQFAVSAAGLALKDAGIDLKQIAPERVGIVLGSGFCGIASSAEFLTGYFTSGVEGLIPIIFPNTVPNAPASNASIEHGFKGPNATHVQRFCSAESALMTACRYLEEGRADIILTGGTDELMPLMIKGFKSMGQINRSTPPFGEGCGIVVLERAEHAALRQAPVRARIDSIATIGMLVAGRETEGIEHLLGGLDSCSLVSFSGTAGDLADIVQRTSGKELLDTGRVVGRSLALGGTALAVLVDSLAAGQQVMHLAASPQGPYYAICCSGGSSVQS
jgi:3-oxoacyl-(acyl-carrier-protein) synthase